MTGPYGSSALGYWDAGWTHVLPLPPGRKGPPPADHTGWAAREPSYPDVMAWIEDQAEGNVALHLPPGVIGLDVDNYGHKTGRASLESAERTWGPLPPTWVSTSRGDGVSGIRLYRVPVGLRWPGGFGPGTETIHSGHRYAVVAPSVHPDTGRSYRWIDPDGTVRVGAAVPRISELPDLPMAWVVGMTGGREAKVLAGAGLDDEQIKTWLISHSHGEDQNRPCDRMAEAAADMMGTMPGAAHESLAGLMRIVGLAARGHEGLFGALRALRHSFLSEVTRPGREHQRSESEAQAEWSRSLFGAVDKVVAEREAEGLRDSFTDPCEVGEPSLVAAPVEWMPDEPEWTPEPLPVTDPDEENPGHEDRGESSQPTAEQLYEIGVARELHTLRLREEAKRRLEAEHAPALQVMGFGEFLSAPRPEPVVQRMLYVDSLARIFGKPGCGKSFLALDLAFHVALGRDWRGTPVRQGSVVYVMAEGQRVNTVRAMAWMERHGVRADELEGRFWAVPDKVLLTEAAARPFVERVAELDPVLIVLDTQNAMQVGEENSASDSRTMRDALDAMRRTTHACVCLIGHSGKANDEAARGSNAVEGAMDTEVKVSKDEGAPPRISVEVTRDKADEAGKTWDFFLRSHPLPDGVSGAVLVEPDAEIDLPTREQRSRPAWLDTDVVLPTEIVGYTGPGKSAMIDTARFLATDANPNDGDPGRIGVTQVQTIAALRDGGGYERTAVRRCWSWLRAQGYIGPFDDKWDTNTTGKHIWLRT